jgi:hypothetical protein
MNDQWAETKKREKSFLHDVRDHKLTIYRDEKLEGPADNEGTLGWYRHIRCARPNTYNMSFEIISVPNYLTMVGDMGSWTFSRLKDNFCFFRYDQTHKSYPEQEVRINPGYWSEKLQAVDKIDGLTQYSEDNVRYHIMQAYESWLEDTGPELEERNEVKEHIREHLLCEHSNEYEAREALNYDTCEKLKPYLEGSWEWSFTEFTPRYLWACHAIAWTINEYDKLKEK